MAIPIRSKAATDAYREGFNLRGKRQGSGICKACHRYPCRCRVSFGRADAPAENRGGRARLVTRTQEIPVHKMSDGLKAATRVLGLAESKGERDMFRSLLKSQGTLANPSEIKTAETEVRIRRGW